MALSVAVAAREKAGNHRQSALIGIAPSLSIRHQRAGNHLAGNGISSVASALFSLGANRRLISAALAAASIVWRNNIMA
jgi:hypothetical protein